MKKTAVALLYSPKNLYDFIWYYSTYGVEYNWIAICGFCGSSHIDIVEECKKTKIFKEVILDEISFVDMQIGQKIHSFLRFAFYFVTGRREQQCKKLVTQSLGSYHYDLAVVPSDISILGGAFISAGKKKKIVILEEGLSDYLKKSKKYVFHKGECIYNIAGFLLAKMGYANPNKIYKLKTTRYCEKYSVKPEKMIYRDYKAIYKMGDLASTNTKLYYTLLDRAFQVNVEELKGELIMFTMPFSEFTSDGGHYADKVQEYVNRNYRGKTVILKRHPRDEREYEFGEGIKIIEVDKKVPGEMFMCHVFAKDVLFLFPSTLLSLNEQYRSQCKILYFQGLNKESSQTERRFSYKDSFRKSIHILGIRQSQIISL